MEDREERIGPLIITGIFYLWLFVNIKSNPSIPDAFVAFTLGATIGVFAAFFMNNFTKVSLHAIGVGGLLSGILMICSLFSYDSFFLNLGVFGEYLVRTDLLVILAIVVAGLVGTSRLLLKAHNEQDLYGGFVIGILSQLIAFNIIV